MIDETGGWGCDPVGLWNGISGTDCKVAQMDDGPKFDWKRTDWRRV